MKRTKREELRIAQAGNRDVEQATREIVDALVDIKFELGLSLYQIHRQILRTDDDFRPLALNTIDRFFGKGCRSIELADETAGKCRLSTLLKILHAMDLDIEIVRRAEGGVPPRTEAGHEAAIPRSDAPRLGVSVGP